MYNNRVWPGYSHLDLSLAAIGSIVLKKYFNSVSWTLFFIIGNSQLLGKSQVGLWQTERNMEKRIKEYLGLRSVQVLLSTQFICS